ncbi:DMT family transporter [Herbiconiux sp. CPCC 203407]|uniref:DMT family transporter n=1 Tax=Herbiconiux oxytropis TaxID=2970915 RepID=A0AA41XJ80_9MICO|nr:DMT family transporter [Herbiconiux oxytropis]MCS5721265.1 DMT family transporter [Herbiconiux oxytropis]MCS5726296.1 DMT family transporter [Herbiconiux oxytropis]
MAPVLAVLLAAVCFGTTGTAQAFGPEGASSVSIGAARILIGGGLLAALALPGLVRVRRSRREREGARTGSAPHARRLPSWVLVAIGGLGVLAYQPAFFLGTAQNGVAVGTVVALGSAPVLTGVLDWLLHRRFPGLVWLLATVIATAGVVLMSGLPAEWLGITGAGTGQSAATAISLPGILASVGAGASYAVYTLAAKALLDRGWAPTASMGAVFGTAALLSVPVLLTSDMSWLATPEGVAVALWLGVVTTAVAYVLFGWGLARLNASTVSTLTLAEPLTATILGVAVLGESLGALSATGLVVLAAGLVVLTAPGWLPDRRQGPGKSRKLDAAGRRRQREEAAAGSSSS